MPTTLGLGSSQGIQLTALTVLLAAVRIGNRGIPFTEFVLDE